MSTSWCETENALAADTCFRAGHEIVIRADGWIARPNAHDHGTPAPERIPAHSDPDPATAQWREAMSRSTGARLREALEANDALAKEHALCVLEVERLRAALKEAHEAGLQILNDLVEARFENERLTARLAQRPGGYHLTDKAQAALAADPKEQP